MIDMETMTIAVLAIAGIISLILFGCTCWKVRDGENQYMPLFSCSTILLVTVLIAIFILLIRSNDNVTMEPNEPKEVISAQADIQSEESVSGSSRILTEQQVVTFLKSRKLGDDEILTTYDMDGNYIGDTIVSGNSNNKHPVYTTSYYVDGKEWWQIQIIGDCIMAMPTAYNLQHEQKERMIVSESGEITSYDGPTNSFYDSIPKESAMNMVVVDEINADTLEQLTGTLQ